MDKRNRQKGLYALGRMKSGQMNKTEAAFEVWLKNNEDILWYSFEAMKFKLGNKCYYSPDFICMKKDSSLVAFEVKGFWLDDARAKIKVAADKFPIKFIGAQLKRREWIFEEF